jgi:hypothetical protein
MGAVRDRELRRRLDESVLSELGDMRVFFVCIDSPSTSGFDITSIAFLFLVAGLIFGGAETA